MNSAPQDVTVVLVHGAWADGSCWRNVILPLRRENVKTIAAQLPLQSLPSDIEVLRRILKRTTGPVVLAGHAYAGAVISATREDRVKALVYVAALTPDEGESVADVFYRTDPHPKAPRLSPDAHGFLWMPEEGFVNAVGHRASTEDLAILAAVQRPIALECIQAPAPAPDWRSKPSWYLLAEEDRMIPPETQRFLADRMGAHTRSCKTDHSPMLSSPNLVVEMILDAVCEAGMRGMTAKS